MIAAIVCLTLISLVLVGFCVWREVEWKAERSQLIQRIQAPEVAVAEHAKATSTRKRRPKTVAADDDAGFKAVKEMRDADE